MAKAKDVTDVYPKPQHQRCGCKVSWYYYKKYSDALQASRVAVKEARRLASQGYDFGYQCPGEIEHLAQGEYAAHYSVVIP